MDSSLYPLFKLVPNLQKALRIGGGGLLVTNWYTWQIRDGNQKSGVAEAGGRLH